MLYFAHNDDVVKIGFTDDGDVQKRLRTHAKAGYLLKLLAVRPGSSLNEESIVRYFDAVPRHHGEEWFLSEYSDPIYEYMLSLLDHGYALVDPKEAARLPVSDYNIWGPEHIKSLLRPIELTGQMHLFEGKLPARLLVRDYTKNGRPTTKSDDWSTPPFLVELCREMMGSIDTDPATSAVINNAIVHAKYAYTVEQNGLNRVFPWIGNILLNPQKGIGESSPQGFTTRLAYEWLRPDRTMTQAIVILNYASNNTNYFRRNVARLASAHCVLNGNPGFIPPSGKIGKQHSTRTHVLCYFGPNRERFAKVFSPYGEMVYYWDKIDSGLVGELANVYPQRGFV